ncbi:hypothetical protein PoB_004943100 [Plakobranchus ocellatus]|uniref:Apple domain-containing protein n=1 Tax=Plakobranchus ocellatus TaxID=259542 RepID=A0AAV4BR25_9GAST|nr:hypothetical protein PoB_004943100 [Plakobranchus ocellatus]
MCRAASKTKREKRSLVKSIIVDHLSLPDMDEDTSKRHLKPCLELINHAKQNICQKGEEQEVFIIAVHSRNGPFHREDLIRNKRIRGQKLVTLIWILYHMIVQPSHCISESSQFVKLQTLKFVCAIDLLPLTSSPGGSKYLECARECKRQPDCTAFMFTPYDVSLQPAGVKINSEYVETSTYKGKSFTFNKGQNFEIAILATTSGFAVFTNAIYIKTVQATAYMVGDIGFIDLIDVEVFRVAY